MAKDNDRQDAAAKAPVGVLFVGNHVDVSHGVSSATLPHDLAAPTPFF